MTALAFSLVILSAFLHSSWNLATKRVSGNLSVMYLGMVTACVVLFPVAFLLVLNRSLSLKSLLFIIATGAIHAVYFYSLSRAYHHGEISIVYPIARGTGVAGTALVAAILLREGISHHGALGILLIVTGTILVGFRLKYQRDHYRGVFFALLVGLMIVSYSIVDKIAVSTIHPVVYIFGLFFIATLIVTPFMLVRYRLEMAEAWKIHKRYSFIIGFGSLITYLIILYVFRMAYVSYVVAAREIAVAIGACMGFVFLKEEIKVKKIIGIAAIVLGLVILKMA
jgi:uncharacterized membrane protein